MSLRINTNTAAINGHRNLLKNSEMVSKSLERLSSGMRINRAADDAAGLIISEQMRAQITGINQAIANSEQAVTMVQTAEGALDEVNTLLTKARGLAIHAGNEALNDTNQLIADQTELDNIIDSVNRIATTTQFGTKRILDGSLSNGSSNSSAVASVKLGGDYTAALSASTATKGFHTIEITQYAFQSDVLINLTGADITTGGTAGSGGLTGATAANIIHSTFTLAINGAKLTISSGSTVGQMYQQLNALGKSVGFTAANSTGNQILLTAREFGSAFDFDVQFVSGASGASVLNLVETAGDDAEGVIYLYTGANGVGGTATSGSSTVINLYGNPVAAGNKGLTMVSTGGTTVVLSSAIAQGFIYGAINGTTSGANFQVGANAGQVASVELASVQSTQLGIGGSGTYSNIQQMRGIALVSGNATEALRVIDKAIDDVTMIRGGLGAFQANTLETAISSLRNSQENLSAAESTIRDVDFASESAIFTKYNILVQSSTSMLAQANQMPQSILKLIQQ